MNTIQSIEVDDWLKNAHEGTNLKYKIKLPKTNS